MVSNMNCISCPEENALPYDATNAASIFEYSKGLLGKTLREFAGEGYIHKKGKGGNWSNGREPLFFT